MVIDHNSRAYRRKWGLARTEPERALSEYYTEKVIPKIKTDRDWVTVNVRQAADGAIVIIHDPDKCDWLKFYRDLILICGDESAAEKMNHYGTAIVASKTGKLSSVKKIIQSTIDLLDTPDPAE